MENVMSNERIYSPINLNPCPPRNLLPSWAVTISGQLLVDSLMPIPITQSRINVGFDEFEPYDVIVCLLDVLRIEDFRQESLHPLFITVPATGSQKCHPGDDVRLRDGGFPYELFCLI